MIRDAVCGFRDRRQDRLGHTDRDAATGAYNDWLQAEGHWVFAGGLAAPSTATVIDNRAGEAVFTDGPFLETAPRTTPDPTPPRRLSPSTAPHRPDPPPPSWSCRRSDAGRSRYRYPLGRCSLNMPTTDLDNPHFAGQEHFSVHRHRQNRPRHEFPGWCLSAHGPECVLGQEPPGSGNVLSLD